MTHVAYPGCYCADCVEGMPHERHNDLRGYIVGNGDRTKWRAWINGMPAWVDDPADATRYGFRSDANAVHAEDEDAWCVVKYEDVATPSARITGDKDRENPVEGAPLSTVAVDRLRLWFFRECNSGTRRQLFNIFGLPLDEIRNQGAERLCFDHILAALIPENPND